MKIWKKKVQNVNIYNIVFMLFLFYGDKYQYLGERDVDAELVRA